MTDAFETRIRDEQRTINDEVAVLLMRRDKLEDALQTYLDLMGSPARQAYRDIAAAATDYTIGDGGATNARQNGTALVEVPPLGYRRDGAPKRSARVPEMVPCPRCGDLKPKGAGLDAHVRWHDRNPGVERQVPKTTRAHPENLAQKVGCRFCPSDFGSFEARREHEQTCDVRLRDRLSLPHEHHWICDPPKGNFVHGKCKGCGKEEDFPSDPYSTNGWGNQPLTKSQS